MGKGASMSRGLSSRSGLSTGGETSCGGAESSSMSMSRRSGSACAATAASSSGDACAALAASSSGDACAALAASSSAERDEAGMVTAGNPAVADVVVTRESNGALNHGSLDDVSSHVGSSQKNNPWNQFQHQYKGKGMTSTALSKLYKGQKSKEL